MTKLKNALQDARLKILQANVDVIDGIQWLGTLQYRTCLACGALDGTIWQPSQLRQIKKPPLHKDCRCVLVPYIDIDLGGTRPAEAENFDQLAKEKYENNPTTKKRWDKLSDSTRRKLRYDVIKEYPQKTGRPAYVQLRGNATFEDYLRGRSTEFQRNWFVKEGIYDKYWEQWINRRMSLVEIALAKTR